MDPTVAARVARYRDEMRYNVEGWVGGRTHEIIPVLDHTQRTLGVAGDIAEIGVHQGMFLLLLAAVRRPEESVVGLDLFERQERNVDFSGEGAHGIARAAIDRYYPDEGEAIRLHSVDSMSINELNIRDYFPGPVRLFSVDGGHTREHVLNDLSIAQLVLAEGGAVMLDDFFGPHWPSVTEGYYDFMATRNKRLAPFLFFQNKLYLTTISDHQQVLETFAAFLGESLGAEMHNGAWKRCTFSGFSALSLG